MIEASVVGKITSEVSISERETSKGFKLKQATYTVCTGKDKGKWCSLEVTALGKLATYAEKRLKRGDHVYLTLSGLGTGEMNKFDFAITKQAKISAEFEGEDEQSIEDFEASLPPMEF